MKFCLILILGAVVPWLFPSRAHSGLCDEKTAELTSRGKKVVNCREVDFGVRAISADYQKRQTEPVSLYPDRVRVWSPGEGRVRFGYVNEIPGVRNSLRFNPITSPDTDPARLRARGHSLLYKLTLAFLRDTRLGQDHELLAWMRDPRGGLLGNLTPDPSTLSWEGRCDLWSAWSIDPEVRRVLDRNQEAALCQDIPFTRGELKELVTVLYSRPEIERRLDLKGVFTGASGISGEAVEDINLALVKLGEFGNGSEFAPEEVLALASDASAQGRNLIFDIDPGEEIWNQPIEAIADLALEDPSGELAVEPSMSHYQSTETDSSGIRNRLFALESSLREKALQGRREADPMLCETARALSESCAPATISLAEQVDLLRQYQRLAHQRGFIRYSGAPIERHALFIRYGVEGEFARTEDEPAREKQVEYTRIGSKGFWSPRSDRLSRVCGNPESIPDIQREERNSLISGLDRSGLCSEFGRDASKDRSLFLGSLPPGKIEVFRASPHFQDRRRARAYRGFLRMVENCESLDPTVRFLSDFELTLSRSGVSESRIESLVEGYRQEKAFLEPGFLQSRIRQKLSRGYFPGFEDLLRKLRN